MVKAAAVPCMPDELNLFSLPPVQVTVEGVITSVLGGIAGLPLGYAGAAVLRDIVDFPFRFDPVYAGIATVIAGVLGLVASVVPARHAARLQPARVLSRRLT